MTAHEHSAFPIVKTILDGTGRALLLVPMSRCRKLYDAATGPKYAGLVKGANHFGIYTQAVFNHHIRFFVEGISQAYPQKDFDGPASFIDPLAPSETHPLPAPFEAPNTTYADGFKTNNLAFSSRNENNKA